MTFLEKWTIQSIAEGRLRRAAYGSDMVLLRLLARHSRPLVGSESVAVLACATSPAQMLSTPVRQLDFCYFNYAGMRLARVSSRFQTPPCFTAIPNLIERNLFGLICCTTTYEVYKPMFDLYRRYLPAE